MKRKLVIAGSAMLMSLAALAGNNTKATDKSCCNGSKCEKTCSDKCSCPKGSCKPGNCTSKDCTCCCK